MTIPNLTNLPAAPTRGEDPATFATKANDFVAALPPFQTELNASIAQMNVDIPASISASVAAVAAAAAAEAASNAEEWTSGETYQAGDVVWSPIDFLSYRANTTTSGTTDPSLSADWVALNIGEEIPIGDYVLTASDRSDDSSLLLADGSIYLQSTYPDLFAEIGRLQTRIDLSTVTGLSGTTNECAFSSDGVYLAVGMSSGDSFALFKRSGDTFSPLSAPASLPTNQTFGVAFSQNTEYLATNSNDATKLRVYKRTGDSFAKLTDPGSVPATGTGRGVRFSSDDVYLAAGFSNSPFVIIYKRTGDSFAKLTDPATLPSGQAMDVEFSPNTTYLAVANGGTSPFITIYKRADDVFTKLANPSFLPAGGCNGVAWSPDGKYLAFACAASPFLIVYERDGDTFTKLPNPDVIPAGAGQKVSFSSDGLYISIAHQTTPFVSRYRLLGGTLLLIGDSTAFGTVTATSARYGANDRYMVTTGESGQFRTIKNYDYDEAIEFILPSITQLATPQLTYIKAED